MMTVGEQRHMAIVETQLREIATALNGILDTLEGFLALANSEKGEGSDEKEED